MFPRNEHSRIDLFEKMPNVDVVVIDVRAALRRMYQLYIDFMIYSHRLLKY